MRPRACGAGILFGAGLLLTSSAMLLLGVAVLRDANILFGVGALLIAVCWLLIFVAAVRESEILTGAAALLFGVGGLLFGFTALRNEHILYGLSYRYSGSRCWCTASRWCSIRTQTDARRQ